MLIETYLDYQLPCNPTSLQLSDIDWNRWRVLTILNDSKYNKSTINQLWWYSRVYPHFVFLLEIEILMFYLRILSLLWPFSGAAWPKSPKSKMGWAMIDLLDLLFYFKIKASNVCSDPQGPAWKLQSPSFPLIFAFEFWLAFATFLWPVETTKARK